MKISLTSVFYLSQSVKQREKEREKESEMNTVIQNDSITQHFIIMQLFSIQRSKMQSPWTVEISDALL